MVKTSLQVDPERESTVRVEGSRLGTHDGNSGDLFEGLLTSSSSCRLSLSFIKVETVCMYTQSAGNE